MIKENQLSRVYSKDLSALIRTESVFHSEWMLIKEKEEIASELKDLKEIKTFKKAKAATLEDKVCSANIKDWKEHKLIPTAFFENQKKLFKDVKEMNKTYGAYSRLPPDFPPTVTSFEEYDPEYVHLNPEKRKLVENYGIEIQSQYLKQGLTEAEILLRRQADGPNKLPEKKKVSEWIKFLREITNVFSFLLWAAAILALIGYALTPNDQSNLWLAIAIIFIILISGILSWYQNRKSGLILETFKSFGISHVTVIREGKTLKIPGHDLVKGDVVFLNIGEKVPADVRVFTSNDLQVDNSPLTGESIPVKITAACGEKGKDNALEASNLVFFSTLIKNGSGLGVVVQIGAGTFMGRIADLANSAVQDYTQLQREMDKFIRLIAIVSISLGVLFFVLGFIIKYPVVTNFIFAIGIVVANVPEGLLTTVTITLAITAQKMLKRNVMIKNLQSVETLGSITVICSDKTGTLTQNKMTVVHIWMDMEIKKLRNDQEDIIVDNKVIKMNVFKPTDASFHILQFVGVCGSKGNFLKETPDDFLSVTVGRNKFQKQHPKATYDEILDEVARLKKLYQSDYDKEYEIQIDERVMDTDASESGILKFFEKFEKIEHIRNRYPLHINQKNNKAVLIPFNSSLKFTCFLRRSSDSNIKNHHTYTLAMKGAPERIIERCDRYLFNGEEVPIDRFFINEFHQANKCFALKGERVIGFAYTKLDPSIYEENFQFLNHPQENIDPDFKYDVPEPNYPIKNLCFVGLISMEDPPRVGVKEAIVTCHIAGIKVIMVTGDQPLTAASIAYQIGIIKDLDDTPEIIMAKEGIANLEEAEKKSNTIIITGDRLYRYMKEDETLSDDNPRKGVFLREWLMKRDVVFARTSPEQKLIIVDGCQKLGHVVAVTGDGVNDSPAIKKADIGIAMGKVGTDVAKDAADILLLDDNFANIVKGIKQGRVIFDTLKKIIGYNLTSNVTQLIPFLGFVILQFPLPLTSILILVIDIGTDVYPNIAFAYEPAEQAIMERNPRNIAKDHLCTLRLFGWGYLFMGFFETAGAFLMYFAIFNDFGFSPTSLFYSVMATGIEPNLKDFYNPYDIFRGNSNAFIIENYELLGIVGSAKTYFIDGKKRILDSTSDSDNWIDYRLFIPSHPSSFFAPCRIEAVGVSYHGPVCYHMIEALRHAQAGFLLGVVIMQVANGTCFRTITTSIYKHLFKNNNLNIAYIIEICLISIILYVPGLNVGFQTRALIFQHWFPALGMFIIMILYSEFTKYLIRNVKNPDGSPGFFYRYFYY